MTAKNLTLNLSGGKKVDVWAARISYVGESGWEIYLNNNSEEGLALYDSLLEVGVIPVGIETYANSRRLEKSFIAIIFLLSFFATNVYAYGEEYCENDDAELLSYLMEG